MRNVLLVPFAVGFAASTALTPACAQTAGNAADPLAPQLTPVEQVIPFVPSAPTSQAAPSDPAMLMPPVRKTPERGVDIMTQAQWDAQQKAKLSAPVATPAPIAAPVAAPAATEYSIPQNTVPEAPSMPSPLLAAPPESNAPAEAPAAIATTTPAATSVAHTGYIEAGGNYHSVSNNFGDWNGEYLKGEIQTDASNRWNAEAINQHEFGSTGMYGDIGNTHIFDEDWYSSVTVGGGASAPFLPRFRADAFLNRKWLEHRELVTTVGLGADKFDDDHSDKSAFLGATYYFEEPWNVQGGVRYNISSPGSVDAVSEFVAVTEGRAQEHLITLRYGYGKEAYQIIGSGNVLSDFYSHQVTLELREWLTDEWGIDTRGEYYHNPNYDRTGISFGVFKEF